MPERRIPHYFVAAAFDVLDQGERLLAEISPYHYSRPVGEAFGATVGQHYRHCLDHFEMLLEGLAEGLIDYDARRRDARVEGDPAFAARRTREIKKALAQRAPRTISATLEVRCMVRYEGDSPTSFSTGARELQYAVAHAVHHYAIIGVMSRLLGFRPPENFGVAPSTLAHRGTAEEEPRE